MSGQDHEPDRIGLNRFLLSGPKKELLSFTAIRLVVPEISGPVGRSVGRSVGFGFWLLYIEIKSYHPFSTEKRNYTIFLCSLSFLRCLPPLIQETALGLRPRSPLSSHHCLRHALPPPSNITPDNSHKNKPVHSSCFGALSPRRDDGP